MEWNIIKADGQLFRIYKAEKSSGVKNIIKVWAKHIFYDLLYYFIEDMQAENCSVRTALQKSLVGDLITIYSADSDIITSNSISVTEKNPVEAIFSIIDIWGSGELKRDNFDIKILKAMGRDTGVLIARGKNITGLKFNTDTTSVVTKLYPVGKNGVKLTEKYINVPNWNSDDYPPFPIIKKVEFKDAEDEVTLRLLAQEAAEVTGLSRVNIDVDFVELSRTKEYENYKHLQTVSIGDLVIVRHKDFGIDVKVPVIKIKKDVLTGVNAEVELGQPKDSIFNKLDTANIKTTLDELGNKVAASFSSMLYYANPVPLTVGTLPVEPVYLGITAVADTNLSMNFSMYCTAESSCTITIQIQLDNVDIVFTPRQKLQQGDNVVGMPLGIPQVQQGAHYIAVFLKVDTGMISIPMFNLQCMIDGRNLQGGLSAQHPHAECFERQELVNINSLYLSKVKSNYMGTEFQNPLLKIWSPSEELPTPKITQTVVPKPMIVRMLEDVSFSEAYIQDITNVVLTMDITGSGIIAFIVSTDSGVSWKAWDGSSWILVDITNMQDVKSKGMSAADLQGITEAQWTSLGLSYKRIRFAWYMEVSSSTDILKLKELRINYNVI